MPQAKFLLKQNYKVKMLDSLNSVCEYQLNLCDSIKVSDQEAFLKYDELLLNQTQVIEIKDFEINNLNTVISNQKKTIRKEKILKWLSVGVGAFGTGFFAYKYITK